MSRPKYYKLNGKDVKKNVNFRLNGGSTVYVVRNSYFVKKFKMAIFRCLKSHVNIKLEI